MSVRPHYPLLRGFPEDRFEFALELIDQSLEPGVINFVVKGGLQLTENLEYPRGFGIFQGQSRRARLSGLIFSQQLIYRCHHDIRSRQAVSYLACSPPRCLLLVGRIPGMPS
jgi:hypothetical protein